MYLLKAYLYKNDIEKVYSYNKTDKYIFKIDEQVYLNNIIINIIKFNDQNKYVLNTLLKHINENKNIQQSKIDLEKHIFYRIQLFKQIDYLNKDLYSTVKNLIDTNKEIKIIIQNYTEEYCAH